MRVLLFHWEVSSRLLRLLDRMSPCISIDTCWYLDKFIWITLSSSGVWDNEMLWQRNIQVIFYFVQKCKLVL